MVICGIRLKMRLMLLREGMGRSSGLRRGIKISWGWNLKLSVRSVSFARFYAFLSSSFLVLVLPLLMCLSCRRSPCILHRRALCPCPCSDICRQAACRRLPLARYARCSVQLTDEVVQDEEWRLSFLIAFLD